MTEQNKNTIIPAVEPGIKHYARINDKAEITELWSDCIAPQRAKDEYDRLLRSDIFVGPYLFTPDTCEPLFEFTPGGTVYKYKILDGAVVEKPLAEIAAEAEALRLAALPGNIRAERNRLLDEADKMLFEWRPMAEEKRREWREYMQELRDLTKQAGFPEAVEWPVEPE
jgi:hypothetical protein